MIISHKHKFIFFKSRKTAGSSIQVSLAKHCGDDDIITGQYRDGIDDNSQSAGLNTYEGGEWAKKITDGIAGEKDFNHPHLSVDIVKRFVQETMGKDVWDSYFKFVFIRNPFEIQVSRYFWDKRGKVKIAEDCSADGFKQWVRDKNMLSHDTLHPYIMIGDKIELDYIGRFENLQHDFNFICDSLNIPKCNLPVKKGGYRDKLHFSKYYDEDTINLVSNFHSKDLINFGYNFNSEFSATRLRPIITNDMLGDLGNNINGPSLIKVPEWVENPLGKYYLYFAHHSGEHIRMAYSNDVKGPWKIYEGGVLNIEESECEDHIASPNVHVDEDKKQIVMYYHGVTSQEGAPHNQCSFVSFSKNGLFFNSNSGILGMFYFSVFKYKNKVYALAKNKNIDGILYESDKWDGKFEPIFNLIPNMRHASTFVESDYLYIFYTVVGHSPESIMMIKLKLDDDIDNWKILEAQTVLKPELEFEGVHLPKFPSSFGAALQPLNQVRDPFVFKDDDDLFLLYSFAGESGIGLSKIEKIR